MPIITKFRISGRSFTPQLVLFLTALFLICSDLFAQYTWTKYPGNPVITSGPVGSWYRGIITPCVIYNADSSRYEMWFGGSPATWGARPFKIGYAKSSDGITWDLGTTAVLEPRPGNWDNYSVHAPCVIRENGQYKMWYTHEAPGYTNYKLGYATSPDGINWTRLDYPVMEGGTASWESDGVGVNCVLPYSGGYKMWYSGLSGASDTISIGYAESTDGINWQRDTVNNPILSPGTAGQWDDFYIFAPRVIILNEIYYMYYGAARESFGQYRVGLATSTDGIDWEKYWDNPVLRPSPSGWDNSEIETATIIKMGDTLKLWYDGSKSGTYVWQIGLATSHYLPNALAPGTYTIGNGSDFATIQDAFDKLSTDGIAGNVTLELIDDLYTAPTDSFGFKLVGPIPGAGENSRVTIKPAENKNVTIEGDGFVTLSFKNTSFVTIDGVALTGATSLTIHALKNNNFAYNDGIDFLYDSDHNVMQNITFIQEDNTRSSGSGFWCPQSGSAVPDNNIIQNNFVKQAGMAFFISTFYSSVRANGNIIRDNIIGSETDSLYCWGIQLEKCQNTIVENNIIQNQKVTRTSGSDIINVGINSFSGIGDIIRNNVVHNIKSTSGYTSVGILLSGGSGSNNMVYNNMVYDIQSNSTQSNSRVAGIQIWNQTNPKIYYNTVYLSGTGNGANPLGSAAFYVYSGCVNIDAKNNIFVNARDESPYCASAIYDYRLDNLTPDYNDLYYDDTNQSNCLVRIGSTKYNTLTDWQAVGKDLHSYVEMPYFVEPYLHIDEAIPTYLELRGIPIAGIDTDFDGDQRGNDSTDIGADEFNGIYIQTGVDDKGIIPTVYALEQNYPNPFNPNTVINYQLPVGGNVTLKVYDILGNEIATLVNEYKLAGKYEVEFSAKGGSASGGNVINLASGVYFYQLKAGSFVHTKKMILLR